MLGRLGELGERSVNRIADPKVFVMESSSSSSGSLKRAKAPGNIAQAVSCLVDGCNSDLSQCKEYHRRHKVCELHSKTPKVTIAGREQRFCQQCSRFHSLVEFDEGKRSCRKRLDGHNRRRRKPQSESLSRNTRFLSNQQGTTLLSFSSAQIFPSAGVTSAWAEAVKAENYALLDINRHGDFPGSSAHGHIGRSRSQILRGTDTLLPEACVPQPRGPNSGSRNSGSSHKMFSDGISQVIDSDCVLSLLSSAPAETPEIGLSHMVQSDPIPPAQPLIPNLHYNGLSQYPCSQGVESKPSVSVFNSDGSDNTNLHCQGMFQNVPDGSSANEYRQQMFSFLWD
uniref:Putative squamosa promoter-binding-like protein 16 isoform X1 n=1 Tax=Davidia involucrata TaxID=16924 RepID=A0A5B6YN90_DAVIN